VPPQQHLAEPLLASAVSHINRPQNSFKRVGQIFCSPSLAGDSKNPLHATGLDRRRICLAITPKYPSLGPSRQGALSGRDFSCATDNDTLAEAKLAEVVRKGGSLSGNALRGLVLVPVKQSQTR
jgi:hypothetical protein